MEYTPSYATPSRHSSQATLVSSQHIAYPRTVISQPYLLPYFQPLRINRHNREVHGNLQGDEGLLNSIVPLGGKPMGSGWQERLPASTGLQGPEEWGLLSSRKSLGLGKGGYSWLPCSRAAATCSSPWVTVAHAGARPCAISDRQTSCRSFKSIYLFSLL